MARVTAEDPDDPHEGKNALVVYSLQKNVIDENSREPIFSVDSETGAISTALCCLDREHTPQYLLRLVATDGGGLKGKSISLAYMLLTLTLGHCCHVILLCVFLLGSLDQILRT